MIVSLYPVLIRLLQQNKFYPNCCMDTQYYMSWVQIVVRFLIMRLLINTNLNIDDEDVILSSRDDGGQGTDKPLVERREKGRWRCII